MFIRRLAEVCVAFGVAALVGCAMVPGGNGNTNNNDNTNGDSVTVEFGFTEINGMFAVVADGQTMPLFTGGQGGSHIFATLRARGYPADEAGDALIVLDQTVTLEPDGTVLHQLEQVVRFVPIADGVTEVPSRFVFLNAFPTDLDGRTVSIDFVVTSAEDDQVRTRIQQTLVLEMP